LAKFLLDRPEYRAPSMPSLGEMPNFTCQANRELRMEMDLLQSRGLIREIPASDPTPSGSQDFSVLVGQVTRRLIHRAFGSTQTDPLTAKGDFSRDRDRTVQLGMDLEKVFHRKSSLWGHASRSLWSKYPILTQRELDRMRVTKRVVDIVPVPQPPVRLFSPLPENRSFHTARVEYRVPSGHLFPAFQRMSEDMEVERLAFYAECQPPLPFGFPIYEIRDPLETSALQRAHLARLEQESEVMLMEVRKRFNLLVCGRELRKRGGDLFGDDEFDVLLSQVE